MSGSKARPQDSSNDADRRVQDKEDKERLLPEVNTDAKPPVSHTTILPPSRKETELTTFQRGREGDSELGNPDGTQTQPLDGITSADAEGTRTIPMGETCGVPGNKAEKELSYNKTEPFELNERPQGQRPLLPQGTPTLVFNDSSNGPAAVERSSADSEQSQTVPLEKVAPEAPLKRSPTSAAKTEKSDRVPMQTIVLGQDDQATTHSGLPADPADGSTEDENKAPPKPDIARPDRKPLPTMVLEADNGPKATCDDAPQSDRGLPVTPTVKLTKAIATSHESVVADSPAQAPSRTLVLDGDRQSKVTSESTSQAAHPTPSGTPTLCLDQAQRVETEREVEKRQSPDNTTPTLVLGSGQDVSSLLDDVDTKVTDDTPFAEQASPGLPLGSTAGQVTEQLGGAESSKDIPPFLLPASHPVPLDTCQGASDQLIRQTTRTLTFSAVAIGVSIACASVSSSIKSMTFCGALTALLIGAFCFWRYSRQLRSVTRPWI